MGLGGLPGNRLRLTLSEWSKRGVGGRRCKKELCRATATSGEQDTPGKHLLYRSAILSLCSLGSALAAIARAWSARGPALVHWVLNRHEEPTHYHEAVERDSENCFLLRAKSHTCTSLP